MGISTHTVLLRKLAVRRWNSLQLFLCEHQAKQQGRRCCHGLTSVPMEKLTPNSIALFHTYKSNTGDTHVTVVTDTTAFNKILNDVLSSDERGVNKAVRELQVLLQHRREELELLQVAKKQIDTAIDNKYLPLLRYLSLAFLLVQFYILFRWVFVVFDWNLVEPMTYFLGYTVVWASIVFHCYYEKEFTWEAFLDVFAQRRRERLYRKAGVDAVSIEKKQQQVQMIEMMLSKYGNGSDPLSEEMG
ncbi:Calcium uniporter protein [Trypanosoma melophagium]|uniref:Calcium uniporter protein n=1 Tax=Trypanosoma melophagium TaxID=715481 RepID=UPI00351A3E9D|nr:Calcium uniporter protein [Trypanosoma melophagium]